ncbi:hypothetical protein [Curvivirga aplysinae]|uniref:hypothetical protein n=1 Tax=Curvivirga aplysinae TaxID=2529852 RepID=UPI0012BD1AAD|nr:hypothetical protein [Curvivirga aplysinae]MTI11243.1 hypothetical protein [Curvivirga aplysinae]
MSRAEVEQKIHDMLDEIEASRIGMTKGEVPALESYPALLAQLSSDVLALPDEDSIELKPLMNLLRDELSQLSWEMGEIARRLRESDDEQTSEQVTSPE